jgi:YVTN family beta-propeller protein
MGGAVVPDGKHAYVVNFGHPGTVSVIDTATNKGVATVATQNAEPSGIAVTPDGKHVYVPIYASGAVSVIDTATNTEVARVPVAGFPSEMFGVGIIPPPPGVPFLAFSAKVKIDLDSTSNEGGFALESSFTLSSTAPGINPLTQAVTLQACTFAVTIPPGSFKKTTKGHFVFLGVIDGVRPEAPIEHTGTLRYAFLAAANEVSLAGTRAG